MPLASDPYLTAILALRGLCLTAQGGYECSHMGINPLELPIQSLAEVFA